MPKGVILSHRNVLANCAQIKGTELIPHGETLLGNLPVFHSFGFTVSLWFCLIEGVRLVTVPSPLDVRGNLKAIREQGVTALLGTPTFLRPYLRRAKEGDLDSIKFVIAGAEKTPDGFAEKWEKEADCVYLEGYGLTETSPVVSCNPIHNIKVETVGPPFKGNQVKIAEDGEILVKGENVMLGYWNKKEETEKIIIDGWLHTGDIGEINPEDGYLKITDRKKDIIVSAGGDNISPAKIENMITNAAEIDQCMVYGDKKNYLVALIVPNKEFLNNNEIINNIIEIINKKLTLVEKIKKIQLIDENFSIENGLLTPTMKVKRKKVTEKYKNKLEKLY